MSFKRKYIKLKESKHADKNTYIQEIAEEDWESGHPLDGNDFEGFRQLCADAGYYDVTPADFDLYWEEFEECRNRCYSDDDGEEKSL